MTTKVQLEREKAIEYLKEILSPGDTVYTILKHVSRSGMYRVIDLVVPVLHDNKPVIIHLSWNAAKLLGGYDKNHEGCKAKGCGMDMGFSLVHDLSYVLFQDGYALKQSWL